MAETAVQKLLRRYTRAEREAKRQKHLHGLKAKRTILWRHKAARLLRAYKKAKAEVMPVHVSDGIVNLIRQFEGGQSRDGLFHVYWDATGRVWTQGFGATGPDIRPSNPPWTFAHAAARLRADLDREYTPSVVNAFRTYGLTWNQRELDATVSFVYNCGVGMLDPSHDFGRALQHKNFHAAADSLLEYVKSGGQTLLGLVRRRRAERKVMLG